MRTPLARSSAKKLVVVILAANYPGRLPPKSHERFVRHAKIPISRARSTSPNLPAVSSLGGFRTPTPHRRTTVSEGAGVHASRGKAEFTQGIASTASAATNKQGALPTLGVDLPLQRVLKPIESLINQRITRGQRCEDSDCIGVDAAGEDNEAKIASALDHAPGCFRVRSV